MHKTSQTSRNLEEGILLLQQEGKSAPLSIGKIIEILAGRGRPLVILLLAFPFCLPIQIPGLSLPFGIAIAFISLRMAFGKQFWLPKKVLSKNISSHSLEKMTNLALHFIRKIRPLIRPRLMWVCHSTGMKNMNIWLIFLLGLFLALPLPIPLSNLTAAWAIFFIALGLVEDDGVFVLFGYLVFIFTVGFFIVLSLTVQQTIPQQSME